MSTTRPGQILIESGETIAASIDIPAEKDTYHFTAVAGDGIIIRMRGSSFGCHIQVFGPDGTPLSETLDGTQFQAPVSGNYFILATSNWGGQNKPTGTYSIFFQNSNVPGRSIPIVFRSTYSGELNQTQGLFRAYTFTAQAGDTVLARLAVGLSDGFPANSGYMHRTGPYLTNFVPTWEIIMNDLKHFRIRGPIL